MSLLTLLSASAVAYTLTAGGGAFDLTGQSATFAVDRQMASAAGAFVLDGQPAGLNLGRRLTADVGAFALSGQAATLVVATAQGVVRQGVIRPVDSVKATGPLTRGATQIVRAAFVRSPVANTLTASVGSFTLVGNAATLTVTGQAFVARGTLRPIFTPQGSVPRSRIRAQVLRAQSTTPATSITLTADAGAFTLTGQDAAFQRSRVMSGAVGAFTLTGQDAILGAGKSLTGGVGAFALTGQSAALRLQRVLTASVGSFALTGKDAILLKGKILIASAGSFTLTGQAATFLAGLFQTSRHQVALFPSPVNVGGPIDANIVRSNDNITAVTFNAHDADTAIHIRSGVLAVRPATATEGSVYIGTDTLFMYIYTSGAWNQVL